MAARDFYGILGVPRDADDAALKKAYRTLARAYHPDRNPGDKKAEDRFKEISEAYSILFKLLCAPEGDAVMLPVAVKVPVEGS